MRKPLVLVLCILGVIAAACGGGASPTTGVTTEPQKAVDAARATVTVTGQQTPTMTPTRDTAPTPGAASSTTVAPSAPADSGNLDIVDFAHNNLTVEAGTTV
ncbi:MAG: hypothetical protein IIC97_00460, partial [Chloroflexi bacterium]|nr:hypothetical protein [Chloroflexota bacterium]